MSCAQEPRLSHRETSKVEGKPLTPMEQGLDRTVLHVCHLVPGTDSTSDEKKELAERLEEAVESVTHLAKEAKRGGSHSHTSKTQPSQSGHKCT